jgi:lipid-binding SYLF domain-containing protein
MRRALAAIGFVVCALAWLSLNPVVSAISPTSQEDELLENAALVFARAVDRPATAIPAAVLMRASAVAVVPSAIRDGNRYFGNGVMSARGAAPDKWTPPAIIAFEGEIPLDLETETVDFVIVAQTRQGADYLVADRTMSVAAGTIAAGPLGHSSPQNGEGLVAYIQFDRYFAGVTIDEWVVHGLPASNDALYGRPYSTDDIVRGAGFFRTPPGARIWRDVLERYFRDMS